MYRFLFIPRLSHSVNKRRVSFLRLFLLLIIYLLPACEEPVFREPPTAETGILIVEGMITNERKAHQVKLSRTFTSLNEKALPVSGATVIITDRENIYPLTESPATPGTYLTAPNVQGVLGKKYILYIRIDNHEYSAITTMVPVTPIESLRYHSSPNHDSLYILDFEESNIPAMLKIFADWSSLPGYDTLPDRLTHAVITHYTLHNIDANALFKPASEEVEMPSGTILYRKKYSLAPDYQEYLRSLLSETAWRGSIFDVLPGNISSNLSEGATGFFAACTVTGDRSVFQPK